MDCMASGLTDWTIPILSRHANLMRWLHRMHARLEGFPTVHSRRVFSPSGGPERATRGEVAWFYLCLVAWLTVLLLPVTLPVLGFAFARRNWNPNRSGARLTEERGEEKEAHVRARQMVNRSSSTINQSSSGHIEATPTWVWWARGYDDLLQCPQPQPEHQRRLSMWV